MIEDVKTLSDYSSTQTIVEVEEAPSITMTQPSLSQLTDQAGFARSTKRWEHEQAADVHRGVRSLLVSRRAERVKETPVQLLEDLSNIGFAWRHIATMIGVSIPALQKWRKGERMASDNFERLALLLATCDLLTEYFINDSAAWFEVRIVPGVPIRPIDLFAASQDALLLDWASGHEKVAEDVLDIFDPAWRETYSSDFETFEAHDGELALRLKSR